MEPKVNIEEQILFTTLEEIRLPAGDERSAGDPCVICLEQIFDKAEAKPCGKTIVEKVNYMWSPSGSFKVFDVNTPSIIKKERPFSLHPRPRPHIPARTRQWQDRTVPVISPALAWRREVYQKQLYSLHIGSNALSGFHDITPAMMARDPKLVSRAKKWVRRELQVFDFLKNSDNTSAQRPKNAEFLLQYVVAILKLVDLQGSGGQAEDMIQEFLGRLNTRIFLHELRSWLRSPYDSIDSWDRHTQYMKANHSPIISRDGDDANL